MKRDIRGDLRLLRDCFTTIPIARNSSDTIRLFNSNNNKLLFLNKCYYYIIFSKKYFKK